MERTSDVTLRIGVRNNSQSQNQNNATTTTESRNVGVPGAPNTGVQQLATGLNIFFLLAIILAGVIFLLKRSKFSLSSKAVSAKGKRIGGGMLVLAGLLGLGAYVLNSSVTAAPTMSVQSQLSAIDMNLAKDKNPSESVNNSVSLAAHSSTGYTLEAKLNSGNLPSTGVKVFISGGGLADPAELSATGATKTVSSSTNPSSLTIPTVVRVDVDPSVPEGDYQATISYTLKAIANADSAANVVGVENLLSRNASAGDLIKLTNFLKNDEIEHYYKVADALPNNNVLSKISAPLANGKYAVPQALNTKLPNENSQQRVNEFISVGQTYVDAKKDLRWDPSQLTPLHTQEIIHNKYPSTPRGLTCSSFVGLTMLAWKYNDTTYVKDTNTASYSWSVNFDRPAGAEDDPFQAFRMLKWLTWKGRSAVYIPGVVEYKPGDLLFFSQQDPEGPGTSGKFYMNVYHVGIYVGDNKIMHSAGRYHSDWADGGGVVIENMSQELKDNLTFVARPDLSK